MGIQRHSLYGSSEKRRLVKVAVGRAVYLGVCLLRELSL